MFRCEVSVPVSHIGLGTCVPLCDPASAPGRQWPRHLCLTNSTSVGIFRDGQIARKDSYVDWVTYQQQTGVDVNAEAAPQPESPS